MKEKRLNQLCQCSNATERDKKKEYIYDLYTSDRVGLVKKKKKKRTKLFVA
jgi:hypothetical protein